MLKWNEWADGIKQGQALWFVDDQLQVPDQHGEVHGPGGAEGTSITLLFFLNEHSIGISWVFVGFARQSSLYQISFSPQPQ